MRNYLVGLEAKMFARGYIFAPTVCVMSTKISQTGSIRISIWITW